MLGSAACSRHGSITDPKRPMFAPLPGAVSPSSRTGILGYSFQLSDDGQFALVEFVAAQRSAFKDILAAGPLTKSFVKGRDKIEDVTAEFKKHRKDFDLIISGYGCHEDRKQSALAGETACATSLIAGFGGSARS